MDVSISRLNISFYLARPIEFPEQKKFGFPASSSSVDRFRRNAGQSNPSSSGTEPFFSRKINYRRLKSDGGILSNFLFLEILPNLFLNFNDVDGISGSHLIGVSDEVSPHRAGERILSPELDFMVDHLSWLSVSTSNPKSVAAAVKLLRIERGGAFADLLNEIGGGSGEKSMSYIERTLGFRTRNLDDREIRQAGIFKRLDARSKNE